jgi:hypothetical protein
MIMPVHEEPTHIKIDSQLATYSWVIKNMVDVNRYIVHKVAVSKFLS